MSGGVPCRGCVSYGIVRLFAKLRIYLNCVYAQTCLQYYSQHNTTVNTCACSDHGYATSNRRVTGLVLGSCFSINRHCNSRPKHFLQEHIKTISVQFYKLILLIDHSMLTVERNKETDHHR